MSNQICTYTHRFICYVKWARHASLRNIYQVHHVVVCVVRTNIELNKDILSTIILFAKFGDKTLISLKIRTINGQLHRKFIVAQDVSDCFRKLCKLVKKMVGE